MDDKFTVERRYGIFNGCLNLVVAGILTAYFYRFAFENPD